MSSSCTAWLAIQRQAIHGGTLFALLAPRPVYATRRLPSSWCGNYAAYPCCCAVCANPLPLLGVHGYENDGHRGPSDSGSDSTSLLKAPLLEKTLSLRSPALSALPQLKPVSEHTTDVEANGLRVRASGLISKPLLDGYLQGGSGGAMAALQLSIGLEEVQTQASHEGGRILNILCIPASNV
ncbi:hypothetical protein B0H14DRAFT_2571290 [Mycena olivaceomarginata]|nr:hypothetical protein B0H14DRAFT_2571290 [Mycena olivaceomarginata]